MVEPMTHARHYFPTDHRECSECRTLASDGWIVLGAMPQRSLVEMRNRRSTDADDVLSGADEARRSAYWHWANLAHKFHVATDETCYRHHHPLCPICNPQVLDEEPRPWATIEPLSQESCRA